MIINLFEKPAKRITEFDVERFTCGDCNILANVIAEVAGLPLYCFSYNRQPRTHCFVGIGSSRFLDVEGVHTRDNLLEKWEESGIMKTSYKGMIKKGWEFIEAYPGSTKRAYKVAAHLLNKYESQLKV